MDNWIHIAADLQGRLGITGIPTAPRRTVEEKPQEQCPVVEYDLDILPRHQMVPLDVGERVYYFNANARDSALAYSRISQRIAYLKRREGEQYRMQRINECKLEVVRLS